MKRADRGGLFNDGDDTAHQTEFIEIPDVLEGHIEKKSIAFYVYPDSHIRFYF